jgi:hypothetical protein
MASGDFCSTVCGVLLGWLTHSKRTRLAAHAALIAYVFRVYKILFGNLKILFGKLKTLFGKLEIYLEN